MSNNYNYPPDSGPGGGASNNGSSFISRREMRASNVTGALPVLGVNVGVERAYSGVSEFELMLQSLHELFEHDRQIASQSDTTRCGICYLYFTVSELYYHEDGYYVCTNCEHGLGKQSMPMLRKQQKM